MIPVQSWGRLSAAPHDCVALDNPFSLATILSHRNKSGIAFGMGRSYGDACLNPHRTLWLTSGLNRFIAFDETIGRLTCEAGVLLRDIQRLAIPRGWTLPVTPGTQFVTVGGAIANDVHGKNHHRAGSFGDHVISLTLLRTDGEVIVCGPHERSDWFAATVAGVGLTGLITQAELQLQRVTGPWLETETIPYTNLKEFFQLADDSESGWEHTVSWIDCLSPNRPRGLFMRANWSERTAPPQKPKSRISVPLTPPFSLVNPLSLRALNTAYFYLKSKKAARTQVHYETFFYPLDHIARWNRLYGPRGFYQYQMVIPPADRQAAIEAMLKEIAKAGEGSFLAVLKTFGAREPQGMLSFPQQGVTLALDFPNRGAKTEKLFERLDAIVHEAKGRLYLAKDARMPRDLFLDGYPRFQEFVRFRDPGMSSSLSRRLMGF